MSRRLAPPLTVGVAGLSAFVVNTIIVTNANGPAGLDNTVLETAHDLESSVGINIAKVVTALGTLPVTCALAVVGAFMLRHRPRDVVVLLASVAAIYIAVHFGKMLTDRARPPEPVVHAALKAYPSGHSAYSTIYVAAAALAAARRSLVILALILALAIGLSRLYLRVHWATDVIGGWTLGAAIFGLAAAVGVIVGRLRNNDERTSRGNNAQQAQPH